MRNSPPRSKNNSGVTFLWALRLPSWFSASPYLQTGPFGDVLAPHFWPPSFAMRRHRLRLLDARADRRLHLFRSLDHRRDASPRNGLTALAEIYTMHSFAPFSKLNFLLKIAEQILHSDFRILLPNFAKFVKISLDFGQKLPEFCRNLPNFRI